MTDTTADYDPFDNLLRITSEEFCVVIHSSAAALRGLDAVRQAEWATRGSLQIGTTGLGRVYWTPGERPDLAVLLIGHDDETWDVSVVVPMEVVDDILTQVNDREG